jgi:hypothetical protein
MIFFLRLKIDELIEGHGHKILCLQQYNCHFIPSEVVLPQPIRHYSSKFGVNGFGVEAKKKMWEESLEKVCRFGFCVLIIKQSLVEPHPYC